MPPSPRPAAPPFTWRGLVAGAVDCWPLYPTIFVIGLAFGMMADVLGITTLEAMLISGLVYAGGAQMAALQAWSEPLSLLALVLTVGAMNARYLLMGASLRPWYGGLPAWKVYPALFVMGDGNWAIALREYAAGRNDAAHMIGSGIAMWFGWVGATLLGSVFGRLLGEPERFGIDFMLPAFFATLVVAFLKSRAAVLPLAVGVGTAILVERLVEGPWYILAGALAGSLAGGLAHRPPLRAEGGDGA